MIKRIIQQSALILTTYFIVALLSPLSAQKYNPIIKPENFTAEITNPYFSLPVNKTMRYQSHTGDNIERIEITILPETKIIMGVTTRVYHDTVYLNDVILEDTYDYLAQDTDGNVWYFGEKVDNYENGVLQDHKGSWIAGEKGALPGIWFPGKPEIEKPYRQEFYKGEAEDMAKVISVNETVTVPAGTFSDCIKTEDWNPLVPGPVAHKYYCREVGGVALETEDDERVELISTSALATTTSQKEPATAESPTSHLAVGAGILFGIAVGSVVAKRYLSKKK